MSKKVKVLISALVITVLLTMGGVTMVMAEGEEETTPLPEASEKSLLERVADILGIDEEDLLDAFEQAQQEMCEEVFISRLNQAVEEGRITREQADEILEWRGQRPEVIEPGMFKHNLRFRSSFRNYQQNSTRWRFCPRAPEETD